MFSMRNTLSRLTLVAILLAGCRTANAETVKIGLLKIPSSGPIFLAKEKSYFTAEGLDPTLVFFTSAEPIAVAVASGDVDFGVTAFTAGLFNLASEGALRIIAGLHREDGNFHAVAFLVSSRAYEQGLKGYADLAGRSVALSQIGSPPHYALALVAEKFRIDLKTVRLLPLQSIPNVVSALTGGQADATFIPTTPAQSAIEQGSIKQLGWVGDVVEYQLGAVFAATRTLDQRAALTKHFLGAFRRGAQAYHDAFADESGRRQDEAMAASATALIATYLGIAPAQVAASLPYVDPEGRLDVKDVLRQAAWFQSQGMVKGPVDESHLIDGRYVVPMPDRR